MAVALVVAAGRGERLGFGRPKALVEVGGRPMLQWSVDALLATPCVTQVVVALPERFLDRAPSGTIPVPGGAVRSESVLAALRAADGPEGPVIVHDAARIFAGPELFTAAVELLDSSGADAVVTASRVTDTIKRAEASRPSEAPRVTETLERSNLWSIQTPQVFRREALASALSLPSGTLAEATDDAWLVEKMGGSVLILPSGPENFKITTPLDLRLAELILSGS